MLSLQTHSVLAFFLLQHIQKMEEANENKPSNTTTKSDSIKTKLRNFYRKYRILIQIFACPLIASIIPIVTRDSIGLCAFLLVVMSAYWVTMCVPIAVTSLLPVFLLPLFGILESTEVSSAFFTVIYCFLHRGKLWKNNFICDNALKDNIMFIMGSLMIGIGVETSNLHQKLALRVVLLVGTHPRWYVIETVKA